jgi:PKD repeat protein/DNA-directed RNA polymerase subunit M/transcription elongation factor TFIIS
MDNPINNISIEIYNSSTNSLIFDVDTSLYGYITIDDVNNGDYYYKSYDENSTFIEYGEFFIGTDLVIYEFFGDNDYDGFYDDFLYETFKKVTAGLSPANFDIEFYDWNNKLIAESEDNYIEYIFENLTEGNYKFKAYNNSLQLSSGSFYVYGNGFENQPPIPVISSPADQSKYKTQDLIKFDGTQSSDPDEYDQITYYWKSDKDGKLSDSDKFWQKLSEGTHKITLYTDDAHGHNPSSFVTISVQQPIAPNNPPAPVISSPTESQQNYTGQSILFDGSQTTDPESDVLTFFWTSNISGPIKGNVSKFTSTLPLGHHQITMYVEDNNTNNVSAVVNISVIELPDNTVPIVNILLPGNNTIWNATDLIIFDSNGTYDPDDDINSNGTIDPDETDQLSYSWVSNISGEISTLPVFNTTTLSSPLDSGVHMINLTVVDSQGANATASVIITIINRPPEVSITQPTEGQIFSKAAEIGFFSSSSDPEGDVLYYWWVVQDKNKPANVIKIHNESHFNQKLIAGDYIVTFYADDHFGIDEFGRDHNVSAIVNISVENRAPIAFAGADRTVNIDEVVEFNASGSSDPDGEDDEANFTYAWNFGDGVSSQGMVVQHTYTSTGMYNVSLTIVDTGSATNNTDKDNLTIIVNTPPEAEIWSLNVITKDALGEAKAYFDASNSTDTDLDALTYIWDFGDGKTGIGVTTTHTYTVSQVYKVSVNVSDGVGWDIAETTIRINTAPVAETGMESITVNVNEEIDFDGSTSYDIDEDNLTYFWDFGDGSTSIEVSPTHKFSVSAAYRVVLNVSDDYGAWANDTIEISVLPTTPAFTSHSEDEKVSGKVTLEGRTYDSAGEVENVQIKIGSGSWKDAEPRDDDDWSTWSYEWQTNDVSNGNYRILARLTNDQGTSGEASLNLTVSNKINYPTISISSPKDGADLKGDVKIRGSTTGESITSVRIRIGSGAGKTFKSATDNSANNDWSTWEYDWDTTRFDNDDYTIYANVTATIQGKNYYDEVTIDVTVENQEVAPTDEEGEEAETGMLDSLLNNTMVLAGLGLLILIIIIILIVVTRKKKKKTEPLEFKEASDMDKVPPELELMEEKEGEELEKPPVIRKVPIKCPKCKDIFIAESDGTLPLILTCETCGARGIIRSLPEEEKPEEEDEKDSDSEKEKTKAEDEDEPVKRKPIIKCPNCDEIFPVDSENGEIECPNCGTKGNI